MSNDSGSTSNMNTTASGGTPGSSTSSLGYGPTTDSGDTRSDGLGVVGAGSSTSDMSVGSAGDRGEGFGQASDELGIGTTGGGVGVTPTGQIHMSGVDADPSQDADLDNSATDGAFSGDSGVTPGYTSGGHPRG